MHPRSPMVESLPSEDSSGCCKAPVSLLDRPQRHHRSSTTKTGLFICSSTVFYYSCTFPHCANTVSWILHTLSNIEPTVPTSSTLFSAQSCISRDIFKIIDPSDTVYPYKFLFCIHYNSRNSRVPMINVKSFHTLSLLSSSSNAPTPRWARRGPLS